MSLNEKQFRRQKLDAQRAKTKGLHEDLRPMKETLKAQGVSYSAVSGHLKTNAHILFGGPMNKKDTLYWAIKKHAEDPENFLKNIGMN